MLTLDRSMDADLPHVGVPSVLMVRDHGDLQHEGAYGLDVPILDGYLHPAGGFGEIHDLQLLQIVEVRAGAYGDPGGGVAFVQLVVGVDVDLADVRPLVELDVHQVRQLPVRLPVRVHDVVSQALHTKA